MSRIRTIKGFSRLQIINSWGRNTSLKIDNKEEEDGYNDDNDNDKTTMNRWWVGLCKGGGWIGDI